MRRANQDVRRHTRDNNSILPLEWAFWQVEIERRYACFQRHQPIFRSGRELRPLSTQLSVRSRARLANGMWAHTKACDCRRCFRYGNLDPPAARAWQPCLWSRAESRNASGRRAAARPISKLLQRGREGGGYNPGRCKRGFRYVRAGRALVLSARRKERVHQNPAARGVAGIDVERAFD